MCLIIHCSKMANTIKITLKSQCVIIKRMIFNALIMFITCININLVGFAATLGARTRLAAPIKTNPL